MYGLDAAMNESVVKELKYTARNLGYTSSDYGRPVAVEEP